MLEAKLDTKAKLRVVFKQGSGLGRAPTLWRYLGCYIVTCLLITATNMSVTIKVDDSNACVWCASADAVLMF
jgi:hypothetical protein